MPTDPWSGSRYPASNAAPNVSQDIQNAVNDLADGTVPSFATAAARDTAFTNWKNAGNTAFSGMQAFTQNDGRYWRYDTASSSWLYAGGNPPPIVAATVAAGWTAGSVGPGVFKDSAGMVNLVGWVTPQTTYNPQDGGTHTCLQLPSGYFPSRSLYVPIFTAPNATSYSLVMLITTAGVCSIGGGSVSSVALNVGHYLDGVRFHPGYASVPFS